MPRVGADKTLCLDLSEGRLWSGGRELPLTPTAFAMLRYFVAHPDRLITKQELLSQVWPDTHVSDGLVKDYVRKIRRVLGDDPAEPAFIETARGRGYRYVGNISVTGADDTRQAASTPPESTPSIAVLAFMDKSDGANQKYVADGIADGIIVALTRFRSLVVIAKDSSFTYGAQPKAMDRLARELDVRYILRGSVRNDGERARIEVQLVDVASGAYVWAERYDRELRDMFALQDEVSAAIVMTLVGRLETFDRQRVARKGPDNLMAYDCLLLGGQHLRQGSKDDILEARRMFRSAIELEPGNARAHAELALSYLLEYWSVWSTARQVAADEALTLAGKAVALDAFDGRAHIYLAAAYQFGKAGFELAEAAYTKAFELNPIDCDYYCLRAFLLAYTGRAEEGIAFAEKALRLSPLTTEDCNVAWSLCAYGARRYDEALAALDSIVEPSNRVNIHYAMCYAQLGRQADARRAVADYLAVARGELGDFPGEDGESWRRYFSRKYPFKHADDLEHMFDGLRTAGFPLPTVQQSTEAAE